MTAAGSLLALFPALILAGALACVLWCGLHPGPAPLLALAATVYLVPVAAFRLHRRLLPGRSGARLVGGKYVPWWGEHQLQLIYIALPFLEALLRLVPGLYSAWLRLWGARIGRRVYWTPQVEITDRADLEVGDGVVFGHHVILYGHAIRPMKGNLLLYVKTIRIGAGAFVGAHTVVGPGGRVKAGAMLPIGVAGLSEPGGGVTGLGTLGPLSARALVRVAGAALAPSAWRFAHALASPEAAQARVLADVAKRLRRTAYGRAYGVTRARDVRERLPVVGWEGLRPWVDVQRRRGEASVTPDRVLFYEKTSGSSGPAKHIPYTRALRSSWSHLFAVWAHDVLAHGPRLATGRMYFSVSPSFGAPERTPDGTPIGTLDDRDYLDGPRRALLSPFLVDVEAARRARSPEAFRRRTAEALLADASLEVVSVWSPSFLEVLLRYIESHRDELLRAVPLDGARRRALEATPVAWPLVWPSLKLVSCWTGGAAAPLARRLGELLPGVAIQGKGLLATEAPVTVPLIASGGAVPLLDEVYLELEEASGRVLPLLEARAGSEYGVVVTQKGGLCRYRLGDVVRVTHFHGRVPVLEFVARAGGVSDLVGEKLEEGFVARAIAAATPGDAVAATLVPVRSPRDGYALFVTGSALPPGVIAERLERELTTAHHYGLARALDQLAPVRVVAHPKALLAVLDGEVRRGLRAGDVKPRALLPHPADAELAAFAEAHGTSAEGAAPSAREASSPPC